MIAAGTLIEGQYEARDEVSNFGDELLYAGQRLCDGAQVDIRIVPPDAPRTRRKQFSDVASIVARLDHPNCVSALGAGQLVDRTLYMVIDSLNAGPLADLADRGAPPRVLAEIGLQLMEGLAHLHSQGVVIGCVTPHGVIMGQSDGQPRLQISDFSFARVAAHGGHEMGCREVRFLSPEVALGGAANERSDLFSAGQVLRTLASPGTPRELLDVFDALAHPEPAQRVSADAARRHFEAWIAQDPTDFDLAWLPEPMPAAISTGVFAIVDVQAEISSTSSEIFLAAPLPEPAPVTVPLDASPSASGSRSKWGLVAVLGVVGAAAGTVVALGVGRLESDAKPHSVAAAAVVSGDAEASSSSSEDVAVPADAPEADAPEAHAPDDALEGNPIVWLAQLNRRDLGSVLPIRQRTRLLDELATRRGVAERVNHRWNAMLDLWQARDADRPCATFAAALASLDGAPKGEAELDLIRRVVVPAPAQGSAAGVAPDDSCSGLQAAFDDYARLDDAPPKRGTTARRSTKRAAPPAAVPKKSAPAPTRNSASVATKLDEDLREF